MKLKTATLIAIIGISLQFCINLCINFLNMYQVIITNFGMTGGRLVLMVPSFVGVGSTLLFFITLYSKQE